MEGRILEKEKFWGWQGRMMGWRIIRVVVMTTLRRWDDRGGVMNQEEADEGMADEVSEEVRHGNGQLNTRVPPPKGTHMCATN